MTPFSEVNIQDVLVEEEQTDKAIPIATRAKALATAQERHIYNTREKGQVTQSNSTAGKQSEIEKPICPSTIEEAMNSIECLKWIKAIDNELNVYINKKCLKPIEALPPGHKAMTLKVCFKITKDQLNREKFKVRITPRGFSQVKGRDYGENYAPTLSRESLFMIVEYAIIAGWKIEGFDISYAYLQADPDRRLFVIVSDELVELGLSTSKLNELMTNMYGLKQGDRQYNLHSNTNMIAGGFTRSIYDPCVYYKHQEENTVVVLVFVDDIVITSNSDQMLQETTTYLTSVFQDIKAFGAIDRYLGMNFERDEESHTVNINQTDYATNVVEQFLKPEDRGLKTPLAMNMDLRLIPAGDYPPIWDIVGSIRYLRV